MSGMEPALAAIALQKRYGRTVALADITINIPEGSRVALVGPNGAGKSTLLRVFIGFERPTGGEVRVNGLVPTRDREKVVGTTAYLHQGANLYQDLTVGDHLALAESLRPEFSRPDAVERLASIGVDLAKRARDLSGGQQEQVAISIALAAGGRVLLLDEPLASLDPLGRQDLLWFLARAHDRGQTLVLSSHELSGLERVCDFVVVLKGGRLVIAERIDALVKAHRAVDRVPAGASVVGPTLGDGGGTMWIIREEGGGTHGGEDARPAGLEEIVLAYLHDSKPTVTQGARH